MGRVEDSNGETSGVSKPAHIDQLRLLSHSLSNIWSAIHWAVHVLRDKRLSTADRQVYEEMLNRNGADLQSVLPQMLVCLKQLPRQAPSESMFASLTGSLELFLAQQTSHNMAQLEKHIIDLKQLISTSLNP